MKKSKILISFFLIIVLLSCKKTEPEPTPFTKMIIGKYTLNGWNGRFYPDVSGSLEVLDVTDSLISIRGRPDNTANFIYFPKFNYQEKTIRAVDGIELFNKKFDYNNVSYIVQDMDAAAKGITRILLFIKYTDANGTRYEVGGEKLGR
jgi:hypothetical protein